MEWKDGYFPTRGLPDTCVPKKGPKFTIKSPC